MEDMTLSRVKTYQQQKQMKDKLNQKSNKSFTWVSIVIIALTLVLMFSRLITHPGSLSFLLQNKRSIDGLFKNAGNVAIPLSCLAFAFWLVKTALQRSKRAGLQVQWLVQLFQFVRTQHILLGTLAMIVGATHSIYFMIYPNESPIYTYTGLITFALMFTLGGLGLMLKTKSISPKLSRRLHLILGFAFGFMFLIHVVLG